MRPHTLPRSATLVAGLLATLISVLAIIVMPSAGAAGAVTVKLAGSGYTAGATDTVVNIEQASAAVRTAIDGVPDGNTLVLIITGAPADFEPIEIENIVIAVDFTGTTKFLAVKGTFPDLFGQTDLAFLVALTWDNDTDTSPDVSVGAKLSGLDLAALNEAWAIPVGPAPSFEDVWVAISTADQTFPSGLTGVSDFYPEDFSFSGNTIDSGATFNAILYVKSVIGDAATENLFGDVDQTLSLRGNFSADLSLFNQSDATADADSEAGVELHLEASIDLGTTGVGSADWFAAINTWTLALDVDGSAAEPAITVSASGSIRLLGGIVNPPDGVEVNISISVAYQTAALPADETITVTIHGETPGIDNIFDTNIDLTNASIDLEFVIQQGQPTTYTANLAGEIAIDVSSGTVTFSLNVLLEGGATLDRVEITTDVSTEDVSVAELATWIADELDLTVPDLDSTLDDLTLDSLHFRINMILTGDDAGRRDIVASAAVTYSSLTVEGLIHVVKMPAGQLGSGVTILLKATADDAATFADLVPDLDGTSVGDLDLPTVVIGFSSVGEKWNVPPADPDAIAPDEATPEIDPDVAAFLLDIYFPGSTLEDCAASDECASRQVKLDIPPGAILIASMDIPDALKPAVEELAPEGEVDLDEPVVIKGTITIFGGGAGDILLRARLPEMGFGPDSPIETVELSFDIAFSPSSAAFSLALDGHAAFRIPKSGTDDPDDYDLLDFGIRAEFELSGGDVSLSFTGSINFVDGWHPFGLEWLSINGLAIQLGVTADPAGVGIQLGFVGTADFGDTDVTIALSLKIRSIPVLPHVAIEPLGLKFASLGGLEFADMIDFANDVLPATAQIVLPDGWEDFTVGVKDIEISWALEDNPELCLFEGTRIRGYLYIGSESTGYIPVSQSKCTPGSPDNTPNSHEGTTGCQDTDNKDAGCFAGIDIEISVANGLFAQVEIGAFTLGPLESEDFIFKLKASSTAGISLILKGGLKIDGVVEGSIDVSIEPDGFHLRGGMALFPPDDLFEVRVLAEAGLSLDDPFFILDARFKSSFGAAIEPAIRPIAERFAAAIYVINGFIDVLQDPTKGWDDILTYVLGVPDQIVANFPDLASDPLVVFLQGLATGISDTRNFLADIGIYPSIDGIITTLLEGYSTTFPALYGQLAWGECIVPYNPFADVDCILTNATSVTLWPALCPTIIDVSPCTSAGLKSVMVSGLNSILVAVFGVSIDDLQAPLQTIADNFAARPIVFDVACVAFHLEIGAGETVSKSGFEIMLHFIILGTDFYIGPLGWDFDDTIANNVANNLDALSAILLGDGGTPFACEFPGEPPVDPDASDVPPSNLVLTASTAIDENGAVTVSGTFDPGTPLSTDTQTVTITWPDGTEEEIDVAYGESDFTSDPHTFADDQPSTTPVDTKSVTVSVENDRTGSGEGAEKTHTFSVSNLAPTVPTFSSTPGSVNEGDTVTFSGTIGDPAVGDTFLAVINWGDGKGTSFAQAAEGSFSKTHVYADDPAGVVDTVTATVTVTDDDTGSLAKTGTVTVLNVPPTITAGSIKYTNAAGTTITTITEGALLYVEGTFTDPGTADTHKLRITWPDGRTGEASLPSPTTASTTRTFRVPVLVPDDHPATGTSSDNLSAQFVIVDDDLGESAPVSFAITVTNVEPSITVTITDDEINEGESTSIVVRIADPGVKDTYVVTVDWGDGLGTTQTLVPSIESTGGFPAAVPPYREVTITHLYVDDSPPGTPSDTLTIHVEVDDDDLGNDDADTSVLVHNLDPILTTAGTTVDVREQFTLNLDWTDVGATYDDLYTWTWHVNQPIWDKDGKPLTTKTGTATYGTTVPFTANIANPGIYTFTVTIVDNDTGTDTETVTVIVKNRWVVFADDQVTMSGSAKVLTGDIGAPQPAPFVPRAFARIDGTIPEGSAVYAQDSQVGTGAKVDRLFTTNLRGNSGLIKHLVRPLFGILVRPAAPNLAASPGSTRLIPGGAGSSCSATATRCLADGSTLSPGSYGNFSGGPPRGTVTISLAPGTYHFNELNLTRNVRLKALGPVIITVAGRLIIGATSSFDGATGVPAHDIIIHARRGDGDAVSINGKISANITAPGGTITFGTKAIGEGAFVGRFVVIGPKVQLTLDTAWAFPVR